MQTRWEFLRCAIDRSVTTSASDVAAADRRLLHHSSPVCSRPRHLHQVRLVDADTRPMYHAALRQLHQIRRSVPSTTLQMLMVALVHSQLDCGNCVLVSLPAYLTHRLQSVLNAVARLIYRLRTRSHMSDAVISLH